MDERRCSGVGLIWHGRRRAPLGAVVPSFVYVGGFNHHVGPRGARSSVPNLFVVFVTILTHAHGSGRGGRAPLQPQIQTINTHLHNPNRPRLLLLTMASSSGSCAHCHSACHRPLLTAGGAAAAAAAADALASEHCLSVAYCSTACKTAHQLRHRPRECINLATRSMVQLEKSLLAVEGLNLQGLAWELARKREHPL